jgi:hypothetical protein
MTLKEHLQLKDLASNVQGDWNEPEGERNTYTTVEYFFTDDELLIFLTSRGHTEVVARSIRQKELMSQIQQYVESIRKQDSDTFTLMARLLYDELIAPIEKGAFADSPDTLVILPDGPLHLLPFAGLKDRQGRITVPGFYDRVRPLSPEERRQFDSLPFDEEGFRASIGAKALWGEEGYTVLERIWARPTLDVNGIWGGFTGEGSKTVLPARASAKISCRLVPDQDPNEITRLLEARLRELCPPTVEMEFQLLNTGKGAITPIDHPAVQSTARAMERAYGRKPAFIRSGGSIPVVASFAEFLGIPSVLMGIGLPDERSHAPNEHLDLGNFFGGIRAAAYLWEELGS